MLNIIESQIEFFHSSSTIIHQKALVHYVFSIGVISDIHSNIEALKAVFADMRVTYPEVKEIYCIGDLVGYGPNPKECIEFVFNHDLVTRIVKGNHDHYVDQTVTPPQINYLAEAAISYQIRNIPLELRWELAQLPQFITIKHLNFSREITLVHGSPQYPLDAYIYPNTPKQEDLFNYMSNTNVDILILGHTHIPFVRKMNHNNKLLMLNPGAVGQPRDNDPRASYAVVDVKNMEAEIRRVEYDIDSVAKRIISTSLPESLATRLFKGK